MQHSLAEYCEYLKKEFSTTDKKITTIHIDTLTSKYFSPICITFANPLKNKNIGYGVTEY